MKTTEATTELMWQIVQCGLKTQSADSECHAIWKAQGCSDLDDFHVPEPWNGDIANAELLFLSINPGYTANELYPRLGNEWWKDENGDLSRDKLNDFFTNRFSSENQYVRNKNGHGFSIRMEDGSYKHLNGRSFWSDVHKIATAVLNRDVQIGRDYALTEIVHCKTKNSSGVSAKCYSNCLSLWFKQVLSVARNVRKIIVIGGEPRKLIGEFVEPKILSPKRYEWYQCAVPGGRAYEWLFIDHPAAYQCRPVRRVEALVKNGQR